MCWHKWTKWEQYKQHTWYTIKDKQYADFDLRQRRKCKKCGKMQDKYIY